MARTFPVPVRPSSIDRNALTHQGNFETHEDRLDSIGVVARTVASLKTLKNINFTPFLLLNAEKKITLMKVAVYKKYQD